MKKNASILFTGLLVLLVSTAAWADLDPRADFSDCGYTSVEETWEPDTSGTLMERVTYVSQCDTPSAGDQTITITTEGWDEGVFGVVEVREAVRIVVGDGIYLTDTNIYDGDMNLVGMEEHSYDYKITEDAIWFQDWTYYGLAPAAGGPAMVVEGYTTKTVEWFPEDEMEVTFVYYDTTPRADPVIPDDVPVLGSYATATPLLPPMGKGIDHIAFLTLGRMYERVLNTMIVNPNTQQEGVSLISAGGDPISHLCSPPPGVYVAAVLKGDRLNDAPGDIVFNGFWTRWVKFWNSVAGDLTVLYGWTSDRDVNYGSGDWWQAAVRQNAAGVLQYIQNAHRSGLDQEDHYDTFTLLNSMYMIESQTVKVFDWDEANPGDFTETTTVTDAMSAPVSQTVWTVVYY